MCPLLANLACYSQIDTHRSVRHYQHQTDRREWECAVKASASSDPMLIASTEHVKDTQDSVMNIACSHTPPHTIHKFVQKIMPYICDTYTHVYVYTYTQTHLYVHTHASRINTQRNMYVYTHVYAYTYTQRNMYVHSMGPSSPARINTQICTCTYARMRLSSPARISIFKANICRNAHLIGRRFPQHPPLHFPGPM